MRLIVAAVASGQGLLTSNAGLDDSDWQVAVVPVQRGRFTLTFELPVTLPPFLYQDVQEWLTLAGGGPGRSYPPVTATPPELQVAPFNLYVYDQQERFLG